MRAGRKRDLLTFEGYETTYDELNQPKKDWAEVLKAWGEIMPTTGSHYWAARQANSEVTATIEVRFSAAMYELLRRGADQVRITQELPSEEENGNDKRIFRIDSFFDPDGRRRRLHVMAKEEL